MNRKQKIMLSRILFSAFFLVLLAILDRFGFFNRIPEIIPVKFALYFLDYIVIGYDILKKAFKGILHGRMLDENFLMAVATIGAFSLSIFEAKGLNIENCNEAVAVMLFYQVGEFFQRLAVGKSRKNISELMDIRPDYANILSYGKIVRISPDSVNIGTEIIVQPGEKVPIDGFVTEGSSTLDTSSLTGESLPRTAGVGDEIISGSINLSGVLKIKTSKNFSESTASKILELVENASSRKSKSEEFISKFARIYTPAVVVGALLLAVVPPLAGTVFFNKNMAEMWSTWIYRSLTFLVISCPCALVISIPLSFFAGIGGASNQGILIKGSNFLETLSRTKIVVFDKTGTLTKGVFQVVDIHHSVIDEKKLLEFAALAECSSIHPISKSIITAHGKKIDRSRVKNIEEVGGFGITANVDGHNVAAGNSKLMRKIGVEPIECHATGTIIHIAIDGKYSGHVVISDVEKPDSKSAVQKLKSVGVAKTVMLTGDSKKIAEKTAKDLGIDEFKGELLPSDKVFEVERLLEKKKKNSVLAFVGDGINDAPVLSRADIGIAMGAIGSDAAIEAADVVLMDDNPLKIAKAIKISRKCINIVYQNIGFALTVKFLCLGLVAAGIANMWFAIFADVGVMTLAVLNSIRALNVKNL